MNHLMHGLLNACTTQDGPLEEWAGARGAGFESLERTGHGACIQADRTFSPRKV